MYWVQVFVKCLWHNLINEVFLRSHIHLSLLQEMAINALPLEETCTFVKISLVFLRESDLFLFTFEGFNICC